MSRIEGGTRTFTNSDLQRMSETPLSEYSNRFTNMKPYANCNMDLPKPKEKKVELRNSIKGTDVN